MVSEVLFSSKSDEWETPQWLFDELNHEFEFVHDLAATASNKKCLSYYSNSLVVPWTTTAGFQWCNPPYSNIAKFVEKAYKANLLGARIVMLLPARTDTKWFHEYIYQRHTVRFIKGRLKFSNSKNSAPFPSMIVIFR